MSVTIPGGIASDDRGSLRYINDIDFSRVKRMYQVENWNRNFIRAWHGHKYESKIVYVPQGAAVFGLVPLDSIKEAHFNKFEMKTLTSANVEVLYIPSGYAHGYKTLTDNTIVQFFSDKTLEESIKDDIRFDYNIIPIWDENYR